MDSQSSLLAAALTEAAKAINAPRTLEETLDAVVHVALASVPGFDHVGVSVTHRDGRIETVAGTDQFVWHLDRLQYDLGEGPCVDAIRNERIVLVEHVRQEQRWPRYIPEAVKAGLRAQLGVGLYDDAHSVGGLNFYSTEGDSVPRGSVEAAQLFADHVTMALGRVRRETNLNEALLTRQVIGQATGLIMERYQISADRAFEFLVRASQSGNIKVRDVAQEVVDTADARFRPQADG